MTTRCNRCLMPESYPGIVFDENGICNQCLGYRDIEALGETCFLEKIHSRPGEAYDCVVGISGGKDSCYAAYLAKRKFGLRVLAVSYDFPFMVDLARRNTQAVCESLGIELLVVKAQRNLEYNLIRNHLISLAGTGVTWGQCLFCHYGISAILYAIARKRDIPFVISGVTHNETWWDPGSRMNILAKRLVKLPLAEQLSFAYYQSKAGLGLLDQRRQFPIDGNSLSNPYKRARLPDDGPEIVPIFDYIEWDQERIEKTLQEETGWQKPAKTLTWRYDCILEPLLDYTFKKDLGISSAGLYICGLIRSGKITRQAGLDLLEECEDQQRLDDSLKTVLDYLAVPPETQAKYFRSNG